MPVEIVSQSDLLNFGDTLVEVIYPSASDDPTAVSDNDHSIVLRITFGDRSFLLTGDIERKAEMEMLSQRQPSPRRSNKSASPRQPYIVDPRVHQRNSRPLCGVSVGRTSPFGHPHPEIVERWKAVGATVMTTGERGMISVSTDGKDLHIRTFIP